MLIENSCQIIPRIKLDFKFDDDIMNKSVYLSKNDIVKYSFYNNNTSEIETLIGKVREIQYIAKIKNDFCKNNPKNTLFEISSYENFYNRINLIFDTSSEYESSVQEIFADSILNAVILKHGNIDDTGSNYPIINIDNTKSGCTIKIYNMDGTNIESEIYNGKSAYEIAVDHGYSGTEDEWIETLQQSLAIPGGNKNQILTKNSDVDGDFKWVNVEEAFSSTQEDSYIIVGGDSSS